MLEEEKTHWDRKYREGSHSSLEPEPFLVDAYNEFVAAGPPGEALDVAGGAGRNALWLARRGWKVKLIDVSEAGLRLAEERARKLTEEPETAGQSAASAVAGRITTEAADLNAVRDLGRERFDLVLVFFYLQRGLFPALIRALKPGGFLIYQTYTTAQRRFASGPSDPRYLLQPQELLHAFRSLRVLHYCETSQDKAIAELVAQKV